MYTVTLVLIGLFMAAMAVLIAPNMARLSHGRMLQNVALWLAIILGIALFYVHFGLGKMSSAPPPSQAEESEPEPSPPPPGQDQPGDFTPPKE